MRLALRCWFVAAIVGCVGGSDGPGTSGDAGRDAGSNGRDSGTGSDGSAADGGADGGDGAPEFNLTELPACDPAFAYGPRENPGFSAEYSGQSGIVDSVTEHEVRFVVEGVGPIRFVAPGIDVRPWFDEGDVVSGSTDTRPSVRLRSANSFIHGAGAITTQISDFADVLAVEVGSATVKLGALVFSERCRPAESDVQVRGVDLYDIEVTDASSTTSVPIGSNVTVASGVYRNVYAWTFFFFDTSTRTYVRRRSELYVLAAGPL